MTRALSRLDRGLRLALWVLALAPAASLALFYSFVLRARFELGRWPAPYQPDPKEIDQLHHLAVSLGLNGGLLSVPLLLGLGAVAWARRSPRGWSGRQLALMVVLSLGGLALMLWVLRFDPGRFAEWFWD